MLKYLAETLENPFDAETLYHKVKGLFNSSVGLVGKAPAGSTSSIG
jgi:hypothetical protein